MKHDLFLQGSYKNGTNLRRDSDVDVVIQLSYRIRPRVAALSGAQLQEDASHLAAQERWVSFRRNALKAMQAKYGDSVTSGRKSLKLARGKIPASADLVVTLKCEDGLAFYLSDEGRWVVSYPQLHHQQGVKKEKATNQRFKRTIRMFKAARNHLVRSEALDEKAAPSYFIECLLYNVPNHLFRQTLTSTYVDTLGWLERAGLIDFVCQNGRVPVFGERSEDWTTDSALAFVKAMAQLWDSWR